MKKATLLLVPMVPLVLAGCGGSSGGPGGPNGVSFTDFESMPAPGNTSISGIGREVSYSSDGEDVTVSDFSSKDSAQLEVELGSNEEMNSVSIDTGQTENVWDTSNSTFEETGGLVLAESNNGENLIAIAGPEAVGFEYQTFGAWLTGYNTGSGRAGVFSVGAATEEASVPKDGSATFTGVAGGLHMDSSSGNPRLVKASATLSADFANRSVDFQTTETEFEGGGSQPGLDMSGNMSYAAGSNSMSGKVSTDNGMKGELDGRFYGPDAQEIGGIFGLKGDDGSTFGGGFGAKR